MSETSLDPIVELSSFSTMKSEVFGYVWTIENFADFIDRTYEVFTPVFTFDSCSEVKWRISLHPEHSYPKGVQLGFCLMKVSDDEKVQSVKYKVSAIDEQGNHICLQTREKLFRYVLDFDNCLLIPHSDLIAKQLLPNRTLTIRCEMNILTGEDPVRFDPDISSLLQERIQSGNDFNNLSVDSITLEKRMNSFKNPRLDAYNIESSDLKQEISESESYTGENRKTRTVLEQIQSGNGFHNLSIDSISLEKRGNSFKDPSLNACNILSSDLKQEISESESNKDGNRKTRRVLKEQIQSGNDLHNLSVDSITLVKRVNSFKDAYNIESSDLIQEISESESDTDEQRENISILSGDLEKLYVTKLFYDVSICTNSVEWRGHKAILSIRSEYFRKAFENSNENCLVVPGIKSVTMEAILYYLYTGKMRKLTVEFALDIIIASRKLHLPQMEEILIDFLKSHMTKDNVTEILHVAEDLELEDLKIHGLKYISSNKLEVNEMEKWSNLLLNNPYAAGEVLLTIASFQRRNIT